MAFPDSTLVGSCELWECAYCEHSQYVHDLSIVKYSDKVVSELSHLMCIINLYDF